MLSHNIFSLSVMAAVIVSGAAWAAGDIDAGSRKSATCVTCHNSDGNSTQSEFPKLAGQNQKYLLRQMLAIQSDDWPVPLMAGQLDNFSVQDLEDIAAWFAAGQMSLAAADPELARRGEQIYRFGLPDKGVPGCLACHSVTGKGNAPAGFPFIAGQHAAYLVQRLIYYRDEENSSDGVSKIMADIAKNMTRGDMEAVSSYMQGLRIKQ